MYIKYIFLTIYKRKLVVKGTRITIIRLCEKQTRVRQDVSQNKGHYA